MTPLFDPQLPANALLPLLVLASSLVPGMIIFFLAEERVRLRTVLNLGGALMKLALVGFMLWGSYQGQRFEARLPLLEGLDLVLRVGALSLLFLALSAGLWFLTTIYAIGYLEGAPHRSRFFGFFSLCVTATVGVAMSGNLLTFVLFFELLTLTTYPLVVHRGTEAARQAGQVYGLALARRHGLAVYADGHARLRAAGLRRRGGRDPSGRAAGDLRAAHRRGGRQGGAGAAA